jgi:predicted glutamine amidotransferase
MPTFALNFSRAGAQVVAQYYNFIRLGFGGYKRVQGYARHVATRLAAQIAELGPFELLTRGDELPVFAFTLKDGIDNFSVFDVSNALRERGWQVPAYTFPEHRTDLAALRAVVRRGFTHDMADMLVHDLERQLPASRACPRRARRRLGDRVRPLARKEQAMCRWLAYSGTPVLLEELLYKPTHSLIDQSLHSRLGAETTNGDGFGVGWYGEQDTPAVFKSIEPAWNDRNLRELAGHVRSPLVFAHIRASTGTPVQQTNCHPFRHGRWLWMHNGSIAGFHEVKRELMLAVDPSLYSAVEGSTDSEAFFFLALTMGLEDDPPAAVERAVGLVEHVGRAQGIEHPIQMTVATSDGRSIWGFRYSSMGKSRSLFYSTRADTLKAQYPDNPVLHQLSDETRVVVSEPLGELEGAWNEVPESSFGVVQEGEDELHPFTPRPPGSTGGPRPRTTTPP